VGDRGEITVPVDINFNCRALLTDMHSGNLFKEVCRPTPRDITVNLKPPCVGCSGANNMDPNLKYTIKGAIFDSQTISTSLDGPVTVDLNFVSQLGAPTATERGLLISGGAAVP